MVSEPSDAVRLEVLDQCFLDSVCRCIVFFAPRHILPFFPFFRLDEVLTSFIFLISVLFGPMNGFVVLVALVLTILDVSVETYWLLIGRLFFR